MAMPPEEVGAGLAMRSGPSHRLEGGGNVGVYEPPFWSNAYRAELCPRTPRVRQRRNRLIGSVRARVHNGGRRTPGDDM
ncbi:hypothetical protein GCM10009738_70770 [Kitasatospora viridis]